MVLKIGHRGACGYEPENSFSSFEKAIELGVDVIELDVYRCKTGEVVVMHDDTVDRTTDGHGYVREMSLIELKQLHEEKGQQVPLLEEILRLINRRAKVDIELKGEGVLKPVFEVIKKFVEEGDWEYSDFFVSSFNHQELQRFKHLTKEVRVGVLINALTTGYDSFAQNINAYSVLPALEFVDKEFVDNAHAKGLQVFVWTVNEPEDIEKMKNLGVDGIVSNFPDRV